MRQWTRIWMSRHATMTGAVATDRMHAPKCMLAPENYGRTNRSFKSSLRYGSSARMEFR